MMEIKSINGGSHYKERKEKSNSVKIRPNFFPKFANALLKNQAQCSFLISLSILKPTFINNGSSG
jgi:hypothetical protein